MKMMKIAGAFAVLAFASSLAAADDKAKDMKKDAKTVKADAKEDVKEAKDKAKEMKKDAKDDAKEMKKDAKADMKKDAKAAPMTLPAAANEMALLKGWVGTWKCNGGMTMPDGKKMQSKNTLKVKSDMNGNWTSIIYTRPKSKDMPAFTGNGAVGWNGAEKTYVFMGFDNMGGMMMLKAADAMAWTGEMTMMGQKMPAKYTFTSKDPKHLVMVLEAGGKELASDDCSK